MNPVVKSIHSSISALARQPVWCFFGCLFLSLGGYYVTTVAETHDKHAELTNRVQQLKVENEQRMAHTSKVIEWQSVLRANLALTGNLLNEFSFRMEELIVDPTRARLSWPKLDELVSRHKTAWEAQAARAAEIRAMYFGDELLDKTRESFADLLESQHVANDQLSKTIEFTRRPSLETLAQSADEFKSFESKHRIFESASVATLQTMISKSKQRQHLTDAEIVEMQTKQRGTAYRLNILRFSKVYCIAFVCVAVIAVIRAAIKPRKSFYPST